MNDHLSKPIDIDKTIWTILRHVPDSGTASARRNTPDTVADPLAPDHPPLTALEDLHTVSQRLGGRLDMLRGLIPDFIIRTTELFSRIPGLLEQNNTTALADLFHTAKGSASAIGLGGLAATAAHWERTLLTDGAGAIQSLRQDPGLSQRLQQAVIEGSDRLMEILPAPAAAQSTSTATPPARTDWKVAMTEVLALAKVANITSLEKMNAVMDALPQSIIPVAQDIVKAMDVYDFVTAADMIEKILAGD